MNERIKKLYNQCFVVLENESPNTGFDIEKFAELIIQECIQVCKIRAGNSDYNTGRMHCASDIAEYFGMRTAGKYEPKISELYEEV